MVFAETFVTAATALIFGVLAAAPATIAYSLARSGTALVHLDPTMILAVLALTVVLVFLSNLAAARRALATSALDAVHPRAA
jgi:ABC-type antimicrobial peptide transport system permease subunit